MAADVRMALKVGDEYVVATGSADGVLNAASSSEVFEVALTGKIRGRAAEFVQVMGSRTLGWTSTSALGDACEYLDTSQAVMNTPTTGQTLYLVSTSADDAAAGTGARTVRTVYLDANGLRQARTDTLNGTTPVSIGSGYSYIQWMEVATVGSGGLSAGNITISSSNGPATVSTTFERVTAGGNRSLSGRHKVPSNCTGYLLQYHINAIGNTMDCRLRGDFFADDLALSPGVFHFLDRTFLASGQTQDIDQHFRTVPSGAVIKISAIPGGAPAGNKLDCDFSLLCIED